MDQKKLDPVEREYWKCFHCGEKFTDKADAQNHFGTYIVDEPGCRIDIEEYRAMEARMRRYNNEDSDMHREIYKMQTQMHDAVRAANEAGYAKGLEDAKKHPEELGLCRLV